MRDVQLPNMNIRIFEEKIVMLQRKLEDLLSDDEELRMKASRGKHNMIKKSIKRREEMEA